MSAPPPVAQQQQQHQLQYQPPQPPPRTRFDHALTNEFQWQNLYTKKFRTCTYQEATWHETYAKRNSNRFFPLQRWLFDPSYQQYHIYYLVNSAPSHLASIITDNIVLLGETHPPSALAFFKSLIDAELRVTSSIMNESSLTCRLFVSYCKFHAVPFLTDMMRPINMYLLNDAEGNVSYEFGPIEKKKKKKKGKRDKDRPKSSKTRHSKKNQSDNESGKEELEAENLRNNLFHLSLSLTKVLDTMHGFLEAIPLGVWFLIVYIQKAWNARLEAVLQHKGYDLKNLLEPKYSTDETSGPHTLSDARDQLVSTIVDNQMVRYFFFTQVILAALLYPYQWSLSGDHSPDNSLFHTNKKILGYVLRHLIELTTLKDVGPGTDVVNGWLHRDVKMKKYCAMLLQSRPSANLQKEYSITASVERVCMFHLLSMLKETKDQIVRGLQEVFEDEEQVAAELIAKIEGVLIECDDGSALRVPKSRKKKHTTHNTAK
eukprot:TRINITY_DN24581_c0_g1_i1.p1 TRINITY_DN24581_c0_g1~~TRINITY_DN24581_c0_g1_i1.p1  ORF type:complete len:487 (+),score=41.34 TRINITY_DN24581_c0_g1_i1:48-1508(+)